MVYTSWSLFYFNHFTHLVSLLVDQRVPEGTCSQVLRSTSVDSKRFESINIFRVQIYWNCNFWGLFTIGFGLSLFLHFCDISFQLFSYFVWQRINGGGSVLEMRIWSILLRRTNNREIWHRKSFVLLEFCRWVYFELTQTHIIKSDVIFSLFGLKNISTLNWKIMAFKICEILTREEWKTGKISKNRDGSCFILTRSVKT